MKIWLKIFLTFVVSHKVQMKRLVVNTTCLELAKPSNQQFRLTCGQHDYHCLLDETSTQEFEVCREWKWIPGGQCSYFNTYGDGNIDGRTCVNSANLVCPTWQYSSAENTKYNACYVKKIASTIEPRTRILHVTSTGTSDGGNSTNFPKSETNDKQLEGIKWALPIAFVIVISVIIIAVVSFYSGRLKYFQQLRKDDRRDVRNEEKSTEIISNLCFDLVKANKEEGDEEESTDVYHDTFESLQKTEPSTVKSDNEEEDEEESTDVFDDALESLQRTPPTTVQFTEECSSCLIDTYFINKAGYRRIGDNEKSAGSTLDSVLDQRMESINEEEHGEESVDVFDDTLESLQRIAPPTDEQGRESCRELYNLLSTDGQRLSQEVLTAVITRNTGKSVNILLETLTDQEKNKLKGVLPEESHRILDSQTEHYTSFHVSYGLHRIFLDEKQSPKSGWGNPVKAKDISIGDDVERLYRIQTLVKGISNPVTVSLESYIRLLNIMIKALTRLDSIAEVKEHLNALAQKIACFDKYSC